MTDRPVIALALGDAAGIGSELAARALAEAELREAAAFVLFGDRRQLAEGARQAGIEPPAEGPDLRLVDLGNLDAAEIRPGEGSARTGAAALDNFAAALGYCAAGGAQAVCFTPFNKHSMRLAKPDYVDEIGFVRAVIEVEAEGREFNVLDELWNARVTSHVPLREVAGLIDRGRVLDSLRLTDATMRKAGRPRPRIAVAALNPHAGDGGNFGAEEAEILAPAVAEAQAEQLAVAGPIPSDTVYMRAVRGEFDAVLSMYHDQGQIAMKLIGFDRGVTLIGGFPFWIATPAHGTAYDIAGQGRADPNATKRALLLAAELAARDGGGAPDAAAEAAALDRAEAARRALRPQLTTS
jgi:4-hydroxythreonine-4-phosphate dehydrogenase